MDKDRNAGLLIRMGLYKMRWDKSRLKILPLNPYPLSNILLLSSFIIHPTGDPKMAKKPMTKSQIVSHFSEKFEISKEALNA